MQTIVDLLVAGGIPATYEYPGFIAVPDLSFGAPSTASWAFGNANATWCGDLVTADGHALDGVDLHIPVTTFDGCDVPNQAPLIAGAIATFLRTRWHTQRLTRLLQDALTIIENSDDADSHPEWLALARATLTPTCSTSSSSPPAC